MTSTNKIIQFKDKYGMKDKDLCKYLKVSPMTLYNWKKKSPSELPEKVSLILDGLATRLKAIPKKEYVYVGQGKTGVKK